MQNNISSSLSSPLDRKECTEKSYKLGVDLSDEEVKEAVKELVINDYVLKFRKVEKCLLDPQVPYNQTYALISFCPSKGATPDSDGVYGMVKVRGTFSCQEDAALRAEYLIRNSDSYHSMLVCYTGHPIPLSKNKKYITETTEIDISKKAIEINSQEVRAKRDEESKVVKEMREKEKELLKDVSEDKVDDPLEQYIELMVKKAQLSWTYFENSKKLADIKTNIIKARDQLRETDSKNDGEYRKEGMKRYIEARQKNGIPTDDNSFVKYLSEDLDLGF